MQIFFGWLTGIALIIGFIPYLYDIVKGKTKPERMSWFIWGVLMAIAFFTQLAEGATWSLVFPGIDFFIILAIFALSFKHGVGGFVRRDIISLCIAVFGLGLWYVTKDALYALLITIGIDAVAAYLTAIKTFSDPESETLFAWATCLVAAGCSAIAVAAWSPVLLLYPLFNFANSLLMVVLIHFGRKGAFGQA